MNVRVTCPFRTVAMNEEHFTKVEAKLFILDLAILTSTATVSIVFTDYALSAIIQLMFGSWYLMCT